MRVSIGIGFICKIRHQNGDKNWRGTGSVPQGTGKAAPTCRGCPSNSNARNGFKTGRDEILRVQRVGSSTGDGFPHEYQTLLASPIF
jgi:hypothetical protein